MSPSDTYSDNVDQMTLIFDLLTDFNIWQFWEQYFYHVPKLFGHPFYQVWQISCWNTVNFIHFYILA